MSAKIYKKDDFEFLSEEEMYSLHSDMFEGGGCSVLSGDTLEEFNVLIEEFYNDDTVFDFDELVTDGSEFVGYVIR